MTDIAYDADYFTEEVVLHIHPDVLTDRVSRGPVFAGEGLADDEDARAGCGVVGIKQAAFEKWDAHGLEIAGVDYRYIRDGLLSRGRSGAIFHSEAGAGDHACERQ